MKIHEITLTEAAPGSFTAQLGVLGRNLGQQITKSVLGFDPASVSKNQQSGDMLTALKATSDKLAQTVSNTWPSVVSQVMANSMDPISRSRGVTDFAKIDKALLEQELAKQVNRLISSLSRNRYTTIEQLNDFPTASTNVDKQRAIDDAKRKIQLGMGYIKRTAPSRATTPTLLQSWKAIINAVLTMVQAPTETDPEEAKLRRAVIAKDASGRITVDGRVLDPRQTGDARTLSSIQNLGLMPP